MPRSTITGRLPFWRFGSWSVRSTLVLLIFLAVIPAIGVTLWTGIHMRRQAAEYAVEDALRLARLTASHEGKIIEATRHLLMVLAVVPEIRDAAGPRCNTLLGAVLQTYPQYANVSLIDPQGLVICSARAMATPLGSSQLIHLSRVFQTRGFAIGEVHADAGTGSRVLDLAYPVVDPENRIRAILCVALKMSWLEDLVHSAGLPKGVVITIIDLKGTILAMFPASERWVGRAIPSTRIIRRTQGSLTEGLAEVPGTDGVARLFAFTPLYQDPLNGVYVAVGLSARDAFSTANRLMLLNLLGVGGAAILALAVAWWGGGFLLGRQIENLARAAVTVSEGDLSVRVGLPPGPSELSTLGSAFNEMAAALQARKVDAERANQELRALSTHLEERVRERTERLADRERELRRSERRFRSLVEHGNDAMVLLRPSGEYLFVGLTSSQVHGYAAEELLGHNVFEFAHPDDRERIRGVLAELVGRPGHAITGEFRGIHKDGSWRWYEGVASNLLDDPDVQAIVVNYRDVTEKWQSRENLRDSDARYRDLFESANDMVFTMNMQGVLTSINRTGEQLLGYTREELLGEGFLHLAAPENHDAALRRLAAKGAGAGAMFYESVVIAKDGRRIPIEMSTKSLHRDGKPSEILAVARDISERKRAEEQLRRDTAERARLEAELVQSAKMASLGIMAGGIAHEVRNPLAIASAAAQLVLEQPDDERLRAEGLQKIHISIQRASGIVENLLSFAAPMSGELQPADVTDLVRETLAVVEHEITQRGIHLQTRFDDGLPPIRANARALEQVFANLILNACQAMDQGGTLTVATESQGSDVTVRVADTGPGIRPEDLPRIFDPFFTTRPPGQGTGLGLAISYRIVEQHRGAIEAFNNGERGATFLVRLPRATRSGM